MLEFGFLSLYYCKVILRMEQNREDNTDSSSSNSSNRKRPRDDDSVDECPESSSQLKRNRVDSSNSGANSLDLALEGAGSDSLTDDSEGRLEPNDTGDSSPEAKRIQEDLLNILDDPDEPTIQGLDSVMKSFEEEILVAAPVPETDEMTPYSGRSLPDLGYLLEASDDELGLPPAVSSGEKENVGALDLPATAFSEEVAGYNVMLGFEEHMTRYDPYEFGLEGDSDGTGFHGNYNDTGDFVVGGLFDFSNENFVPTDESERQQWRPESLPAL